MGLTYANADVMQQWNEAIGYRKNMSTKRRITSQAISVSSPMARRKLNGSFECQFSVPIYVCLRSSN
uniref:SCP domain-containing protein n=1 Tax=Ascaris lumbricoides TaxID=6252 RepID=A0A0M3IG68_ASCLU